ncbi:MAG TPA: DnaJ domain-containing protein [Vitreimonas sp.]|nr:DnaJ domain-containing protein [Vitreimonas sp.]
MNRENPFKGISADTDYYAVLGVSPDADAKGIKNAFREKARETHPDVNPSSSDATSRFQQVNEAYEVLSDAQKRRQYDQLRVSKIDYQLNLLNHVAIPNQPQVNLVPQNLKKLLSHQK